ncbi:MAG: DNA mismatch repair protein MutS [Rhizobiaceae bacterium]|nr:DNA mismatch repair protein MutS [Rhizobiaceae bacterium]
MMAQYLAIKAANPGSLLFYRMGDFYELFFDDAVTASRALGITLTKRGKHNGDDIAMCGVPVHTADDYLAKLIASGFKVAVCEQMEDPAEARKRGSKSVVHREVIRLVTPGTITEEALLAPGEASILMALGRRKADGDRMALAWLDLSTGDVRLAETTTDRLVADVLRIDPREFLVPDTAFGDETLKPALAAIGRAAAPLPASLFDSTAAGQRIADAYGVMVLDGIGEFSGAERAALGGLLAYVERTQKASRPQLALPKREQASDVLFIDAATRANLELTRTLAGERRGSLLAAVDRTLTGPGARLLAERIAAPLTDPAAIDRRLDAVSFLLAEDALRARLRAALKEAADMARALSRLALQRGGPRDLGAIRAGLTAARSVHDLLPQAAPSLVRDARTALVGPSRDLCTELARMLADTLPVLARDGGFIADGAMHALDELRALRDESRGVIAAMQGRYAEETGVRALKIRHNAVLGYFIEVTQNHADAMAGTPDLKARFIHRQTLANAMRFTTTELAELDSKIANAAGAALALELDAFETLSRAVQAEASAIRTAAGALAELDVAAGLAELADDEGWCRPLVDASLDFEIVAGRHPVVEQALRREAGPPFIANDCRLSPTGDGGRGAIWLLTGPNMGGKSTFLRQNALIALLAQAGSFVPAGSARIGVIDRLFSRVGASDDLARGRSTFMVEMIETAAILNHAGERSLVILDEIGRGTATYDGLSIAWGALEHLHEVNGCRTIFATHFHELTALSAKLSRLKNVTMRVKEFEGDVVFLHEVAQGAADRSYGVQVARLAGLPPAVVARAKMILEELEKGGAGHTPAKLVDDLPLFSVPVRRQAAAEPAKAESAVLARLAALSPDELTPREALDLIYELRSMAKTV